MTAAAETTDTLTAIRAAWEAEASSYDQVPGHELSGTVREEWRRLLAEVFRPLGETISLRILDVGAGTGAMALLMSEMGYQVTAVDLAPGMLAVARGKAERLGHHLTLVEARADRLPFDDEAFDAVFSRHLLWTLPSPRAALREWTRVVRPGGLVAVADGWWGEPGRSIRARQAVGRAARRLFERGQHSVAGYEKLGERLPLCGGVSPYSVRYWLAGADLTRIRVRDLAAIRAAERRVLPPWRWIDQPRSTWLATGYREA